MNAVTKEVEASKLAKRPSAAWRGPCSQLEQQPPPAPAIAIPAHSVCSPLTTKELLTKQLA